MAAAKTSAIPLAITTDDIEDWAATLVWRALALSTIRNYVGVLSGCSSTRRGTARSRPTRPVPPSFSPRRRAAGSVRSPSSDAQRGGCLGAIWMSTTHRAGSSCGSRPTPGCARGRNIDSCCHEGETTPPGSTVTCSDDVPLSKTRSCRHFANIRLGFGRTAAEDRLANPQVRGLLIYVDGPPPDPSTGMKIGRSAVRPRPWPPQTRRSILRASVAAAPCRTLRRSPHSAASSVWALRSHQTCHTPPVSVTPDDPVHVGWWDQQLERMQLLVDPRPASIARNDAQTG